MSSIPPPIHTSLAQAAQAQQVASKARDKERAADDRTQRFQDLVDLRVAGTEAAEAVRSLPQNDSGQAEAEHDARAEPEFMHGGEPDDDHAGIDVTG